jgi:hypothetical protein
LSESAQKVEKIAQKLGIKESKNAILGVMANGKNYDIMDIFEKLVEKAFDEKINAPPAPVPAKPKKKEHFFWAFEKSDSSTPLYFSGIVNGIVNWTDSIHKAFLFSTKEDATFYQTECILKGWDMFRELHIHEHVIE